MTIVTTVNSDIAELRHLISKLEQWYYNNQRTTTILDAISDYVVHQDNQHRVLWANRAYLELTGLTLDQIIGLRCFEIRYGKKQPCKGCPINSTISNKNPHSAEMETPDGKHWFIKGYPVIDSEHKLVGVIEVSREITERKLLEQTQKNNIAQLHAINLELQAVNEELMASDTELRQQKAYFQQLFDNSPQGIAILDNEDRVIEVNNGFLTLFRYSQEEVMGCYINDLIAPDHMIDEASSNSNAVAVLTGGAIDKESVRKRKDGSLVPVSILAYPILVNNSQVGIYAIYSDITVRKETEEKMRYLSLNDSLTGIYNRAYFMQEMHRLERGRFAPVGVIICDVDGLKLVNDTLGHDAGDKLLITAASVIKNCFRGCDVVARIGGNEFAVLMPQCDEKALQTACQRIKEEVERYNSQNPDLLLSMSLGFAVSNNTSPDMNALLKKADNMMYQQKLHNGRRVRRDMIQNILCSLQCKDFVKEGHVIRLQHLVYKVAEKLNLSESHINNLNLLAQFHDIGKVSIPLDILLKNGPLTPEELSQMKKHCEIGHRIALSAPDLFPIADLILKHHEWWDGNGYPLGLKGEEIPIECRILAIADAYDAMTSDRPYRKAMDHLNAIAELKRCSGTQFDPWLVKTFLKLFE